MASFWDKVRYSLPGNQGPGEDEWNSQGRGWGKYQEPQQLPDVNDLLGNQLRLNNGPPKSSVTQEPENKWADIEAAFWASRPPTPKIISGWNYSDQWNKAQSQAAKEAGSFYNNSIKMATKSFNNARKKAEQQFNLSKEGIQTQLDYSLEDSATQRARTGEDTQAAIDKINKGEGIYQQDEGRAFDQNYRQVAEQLAAAGAATTGLGQQQTADMVRLRNVQNQRQLDEFQDQRAARELFKTRTFEDLARSDERAQQSAAFQTKGAQFDLDWALENAAEIFENEKLAAEVKRSIDTSERTQSIYDANVGQWLAGLVNQGHSAADVAATAEIYGR